MNFNFLHSLHSTPFAGSTFRAAHFWGGVFYRPLPSKFPTCQRKLPPGNYCVCATEQEENMKNVRDTVASATTIGCSICWNKILCFN